MSQAFAERLGWVPKSDHLQVTMGRALHYAQENHHSEVTLEHLLLALFEDPNARTVLEACQIDASQIGDELSNHIQNDLQVVQSLGDKPADPSEGLKKVMAHASAAAEQSQRNVIDGAIVLAALIGEGESFAAHLLNRHGLTFEVVVSNLKNNSNEDDASIEDEGVRVEPDPINTESRVQDMGSPIAAGVEAETQSQDHIQVSQWPHYPEAGTGGESQDYGVPSEYNDLDQDVLNGITKPKAQQETQLNNGDGLSSESTVEDILASVREIIGVQDEQEELAKNDGSDETSEKIQPNAPELSEEVRPLDEPQQSEPVLQVPETRKVDGYQNNHQPPQKVASPQMPLEQTLDNMPLGPKDVPQRDGRIDTEQVVPPQQRQNNIPNRPDQRDMPPLVNDRQLGERPFGERQVPQENVKMPPPPPNQAGYQMPPPDGRPMVRPMAHPQDGTPLSKDARSGPQMMPGQRNDPPPLRRMGPPQGEPRAKKRMALPPDVSKGQLIENIPRSMRSFVPVEVEVRLAKNDVQNIERGLVGNNPAVRHNVMVTEAMTLQIVAPQGGFTIEHRSPETQWIDNRLGLHGDNFASWKWTITPQKSGEYPLHLVISARIVGERGVIAQSALPEQLVKVSVKVNYGRVFKRVAGWTVLALAGGALGKYSEFILQQIM